VAIGDLDGLYADSGGLAFDLESARIHPMCVRPNLRGVSALVVRNDSAEACARNAPATGSGWRCCLERTRRGQPRFR